METIEYRTRDKSDWGSGEWQDEPDKKQWLDAATGLPCLIVRNDGGALCGYVGVPIGHPLYEKDYNDADVEVHGGLTFANHCSPNADESKHICHKTDGDDHVWWLGFDCAHCYDLSPAYEKWNRENGFSASDRSYRNFSYVTREVTSLAAQLKDYTSRDTNNAQNMKEEGKI